MTIAYNNKQILRQYISEKTKSGWQIISREEDAVQLRHPKEWNRLILILGAMLSPFGIGLFLLAFALFNYAFSQDKVEYVTVEQLKMPKQVKTFPKALLIIMGVAILIFVVASGTMVLWALSR